MKAHEDHPHRDKHPRPEGEAGHPAAPQGGEAPKPNAGAAPASSGQAAPSETEKLLAAKTKECRELVEHLQRVAAEYSNYQKRMERHLHEESRQVIRDLALDILPAVDNLERAMAHAKEPKDFAALLEGVKAVHAQMLAALKKHGVTLIEAVGEAFDPEHHEAVALLPSETHPAGKVMEEVQKGYRLDGRILRATRVTVSGGPSKPEKPEPSPGEPSPDGEAGKA
jgi:molecular chaperone GrpE